MNPADDSREGSTLRLRDGRVLSYAAYGRPDGYPVFGFHGTPGSRRMMQVLEPAALAADARLIAPERPGYGFSQPNPRGTLLGYPDDIRQLADALQIERFGVLGVSGGGPFALACAHQLGDRMSAAGVLSGIGPLGQPGSTRGMIAMNRILFTLGKYSPGLVGFLMPRLIKGSLRSMDKHIREGTSPSADLPPQVLAMMIADQRESVLNGGDGIALDMQAIWRAWGFNFEDIETRVLLWHGDADNLAPAALARQIADRLQNSDAVFFPGEGHTDPLIKHGEEIFSELVNAARSG